MSPARLLATVRAPSRKLIAFLSMVVLAVMSVVGYLIWTGYQVAIHNAEITTRDYAAILEAQLEATLRRADAGLRELAHTIPVAALSRQAVPRYARELNANLDLHLFNFKEIGGFLVADRYGDLLYTATSASTARVNIADRDYFRQLRDNPKAGLVFSEVITGRITHRQILVMARALTDGRGSFLGVIFAPLELEHFQALFQSLALGRDNVIALRRSDDLRLILRWPHLADYVNKRLDPQHPFTKLMAAGDKAGTLEFAPQADGIRRIFSYRVLERYPVFVSVGVSRDNVLAQWRARSLAVGALSLLLLGMLAWLLFRLWRALAREAQTTVALKESERFARASLDALSSHIAVLDGDGRILATNRRWRAFAEQNGQPPDWVSEGSDYLGVSQQAGAMGDEGATAAATLIRDLISGRRMEGSFEYACHSPHEQRWFVCRGSRFSGDGPVRVVMSHEDITERKRAEEAQAWLAAIVENSNDAIIGRSLDGKILSWNAAAERLYGYNAGEAIGRPITLIMPPGHHADAERHSAVLQGGGDIPRAETVRQTKDGRLITVLRGISPIKSDAGEVIGAAITARDVSEHKRSETQLRLAASVFDNAGEGILITDKDNNILSVNRAFTEITGYSPEEAIGRDPRMLSSGRQSSAFYDALWASIRQTGRWQGELWDRRKDGQYYCELLSIAAIRDDKGEIAQHCTIFSDITKLKMAEAELMALNAQLEHRVAERTAALDHANKELEAFSYSVSHDLRAPLRHISGFSAIVLEANEGKLDAASVDYLKRISAASERMGLLIADLLELSRISRQELNKRDLDLSEFARQVVDVLVKAHPEREVKVTVKPDMSTSGDPGLMRIVLENLIGNAWKFTSRANEPGIEVGFEQRGGETVYYVRDNGAGFDMNYAKKLFEPFQRLHTNREFQGTGIGLSIVGRIVARHGGRIWAEARVGEGAAFYFTLGKSG